MSSPPCFAAKVREGSFVSQLAELEPALPALAQQLCPAGPVCAAHCAQHWPSTRQHCPHCPALCVPFQRCGSAGVPASTAQRFTAGAQCWAQARHCQYCCTTGSTVQHWPVSSSTCLHCQCCQGVTAIPGYSVTLMVALSEHAGHQRTHSWSPRLISFRSEASEITPRLA
jgi:hypothetical protein